MGGVVRLPVRWQAGLRPGHHRQAPSQGQRVGSDVIGEIEGRNCVIADDMIDTAGTLVKAAEVLKSGGAKSVFAYCTHPIFRVPAIERIRTAPDEVVITPSPERVGQGEKKIPTVRGPVRRNDPFVIAKGDRSRHPLRRTEQQLQNEGFGLASSLFARRSLWASVQAHP